MRQNMPKSYTDETKAKLIVKLKDIQNELPDFLGEFFRGIADQNQIRTRVGYAYDLRIFFCFLFEECKKINCSDVKNITVNDLTMLTADDIEEYLEYLTYYVKKDDKKANCIMQNEAQGKSRKLAAVRTMFKYYYRKGKIPADPAGLVGFPKLHEKNIVSLETDEMANLLDSVDSGENLSEREQKFHSFTKLRDAALFALLLGTGMRVSECVGVDLHHIDFKTHAVKVTRKGGDESILYFNDEVAEALVEYLGFRKKITPLAGHEAALFLSMQRRRITDRAVQNLVKKYTKHVTPLKTITPHKLRSTFGTQLYRETGDIYLVANVLGHADVNTTRKHYAKMDDDRRRKAARSVHLRKN
ncbi:MAG: tyrosine-type recombinase/integrase [Defluviitaleaceae bacterium]|nr:tyrosine-type recombinase/integrase [Defluviitaleaceae bacterium]